MNFSTPTTPKPFSKKAILLIGPPGGGKTTLAMQFPKPCFLDCDRNLDGPEQFIRKTNPNLSYAYVSIFTDDSGKPVPIEFCFQRLLTKITEAAAHPDVSTLVIDSLTFVNEFIIRKVLVKQLRTEMEARDWGPFKTDFLTLLLDKLRSANKDYICTVHEKPVYGKPSKQDMLHPPIEYYAPTIQGALSDYLAGLFTDVWRCTATPPVGGKQGPFQLQTIRDGLCPDLKSSCGMPATLPATWGEVSKYLKL